MPEFTNTGRNENASAMHETQFQVTEFYVAGYALNWSGKPGYLDILGHVLLHSNQWMAAPHQFLS
jgi:hypothetical protein